MLFGGPVPTKKHRDVTTYHIGMWLPFASRCDNLSHQGTITLHITGAKAAERKCSMTNRETPHDERKTLHETFANAACPKQNAAWWNWSHGGGRGARSPTIWHEFPCMGKRILRYSLGTFPVSPKHFPCIPKWKGTIYPLQKNHDIICGTRGETWYNCRLWKFHVVHSCSVDAHWLRFRPFP